MQHINVDGRGIVCLHNPTCSSFRMVPSGSFNGDRSVAVGLNAAGLPGSAVPGLPPSFWRKLVPSRLWAPGVPPALPGLLGVQPGLPARINRLTCTAKRT